MTIFLTFIVLVGWNLSQFEGRMNWLQKTRAAWSIDLAGLLMQGVVIPLLQVTIIYQFYHNTLLLDRGSWQLHPIVAFSLSFVGVDYLYYWNHRLLHTKWLWPTHLVHHTVTAMDILGTSRNTLWTSFLIVYLWVHGLFIYLLPDPGWYILGASLTSALDLWRHSQCHPAPILVRFFQSWLILPRDHAWHHAEAGASSHDDRSHHQLLLQQHCNFGANFKFWDKIHGTYYDSTVPPDRLGRSTNLSLSQQLIDPYQLLRK
jgi:sterol desaturase/sphingolipid hydroxylase (fatty acid hydroxylase superfamily)